MAFQKSDYEALSMGMDAYIRRISQLSPLGRLTERVRMCFDGDERATSLITNALARTYDFDLTPIADAGGKHLDGD